MKSNQEAEKQYQISRFYSMQSTFNQLRSKSERLLQESFMLQMECYVKNLESCLKDYDEMRLKLHSIKMHRTVDEFLCLKRLPGTTLRSFKSKLKVEFESGSDIKNNLDKLEPCFEFSNMLLNEEMLTIDEGIKATKAHLGLL